MRGAVQSVRRESTNSILLRAITPFSLGVSIVLYLSTKSFTRRDPDISPSTSGVWSWVNNWQTVFCQS
ncbi:hypothetical protein ACLK17_25850 [Escherichia coli]